MSERGSVGAGEAAAWRECRAFAKVNLGLRIAPPMRDGYHPIETIFCRVELADHVRLRVRPDPEITLRLSGPETAPPGSDNLAYRAAEAFRKAARADWGVAIEIEKRIPPESGLGGGSSDAAAVLRLLAEHAGATISSERLFELAGALGADVPFFLLDSPMALAWNRGDRLIELPPLETRPILILCPEVGMPTVTAYELWDERYPTAPMAPGAWSRERLGSWKQLSGLVQNDFEEIVFERIPALETLKRELVETSADLVSLCGSGSALFAVYSDAETRDVAARRYQSRDSVRALPTNGPV